MGHYLCNKLFTCVYKKVTNWKKREKKPRKSVGVHKTHQVYRRQGYGPSPFLHPLDGCMFCESECWFAQLSSSAATLRYTLLTLISRWYIFCIKTILLLHFAKLVIKSKMYPALHAR